MREKPRQRAPTRCLTGHSAEPLIQNLAAPPELAGCTWTTLPQRCPLPSVTWWLPSVSWWLAEIWNKPDHAQHPMRVARMAGLCSTAKPLGVGQQTTPRWAPCCPHRIACAVRKLHLCTCQASVDQSLRFPVPVRAPPLLPRRASSAPADARASALHPTIAHRCLTCTAACHAPAVRIASPSLPTRMGRAAYRTPCVAGTSSSQRTT